MDKVTNPLTGRQIKVGSSTYNKLVREGVIGKDLSIANLSSNIELIPTDILLILFAKLSKKEIIRLCQSNKKLYQRCQTERISNYIDNIPDVKVAIEIKKDRRGRPEALFGWEGHTKSIPLISSTENFEVVFDINGREYKTLAISLSNQEKGNSILRLVDSDVKDEAGRKIPTNKVLEYETEGKGYLYLAIPRNPKFITNIYLYESKFESKEIIKNKIDLNRKPFGPNIPAYTVKELKYRTLNIPLKEITDRSYYYPGPDGTSITITPGNKGLVKRINKIIND